MRREFICNRPIRLAIEDDNVTFSLLVTNQSNVSYQWLLNTTNLPGAITSVSSFDQLEFEFERADFQLCRFQRGRFGHERAGAFDG